MEQSGRNQWQSVANGNAPKSAKSGKNRCRGCDLLPIGAHGKEGVDGSSPPEGSARRGRKSVLFRSACSRANVRWYGAVYGA
jgi:hypothetical protein